MADSDNNSDDHDMSRYGKIILKNVLYTEQLVDDLKLTYQLQSSMLPMNREKQNISRFVKELVIDILNTPAYENSQILFETESEDLICEFDKGLLRRALNNILINAIKHNNGNTEVNVNIIRNGKYTNIVVKDNGMGMTDQKLDGLFKRYYRGTNTEIKVEGTGLGMAIAKQIVDAHGGKILAESAPGKGTCITILLPD